MANKKVSALTALTSIAEADELFFAQSGNSRRGTFRQLLDRVFSQAATIVMPSGSTRAQIQTAIDTLSAAGGGVVQLVGAIYTLDAALVPKDNVLVRGVTHCGPNIVMGPGSSDFGNPPTAGTVLRGANQNIDLVAFAATARVAPYVPGSEEFLFLDDCVLNCGLEAIHFDYCRNGIVFGAKWTAGPAFSRFKDLHATRCVQWGMQFNNFVTCDFDNLTVYISGAVGNGIRFAALQGPISNVGNSTFEVIGVDGNIRTDAAWLGRGIVWETDYNSRFNYLTASHVQVNKRGDLVSQTFTATNGSSSLTIATPANIGKWPVGMPVKVTTTQNTYAAETLYFVTFNDGVNTIKLGAKVGDSTSFDVANGWDYRGNVTTYNDTTGSITLQQRGFPNIEIVAQGHNLSEKAIQSMEIRGVDAEGYMPCCFLTQYAVVDLYVNIAEGSPDHVLTASLCGRSSEGLYKSGGGGYPDFDDDTAKRTLHLRSQITSDGTTATDKRMLTNRNHAGWLFDRYAGTWGISFGTTANGTAGDNVNGTGDPYTPPQIQGLSGGVGNIGGVAINGPLVTKVSSSTNAALTFFNFNVMMRSWVYTGSTDATWTLDDASTVGGMSALSGCGGFMEIKNATAFVMTIVGNGANFNFDSAQTSWLIGPGGFLRLRLAHNGSANSWIVEECEGCTPVARTSGSAGAWRDLSAIPGSKTMNYMRGRVAFSAGASTVTVTNSLVKAAHTTVLCQLVTADATLTSIQSVVVSDGSFVVTGNANATAATKFDFFVVNG